MRTNQLFLSMIKNPLLTGAVAPSSKYLANAMAREAAGDQPLVELGAGTGAITQGLIQRFPDKHLIAVEYQPDLAKRLAQRFAKVDVKQATAKDVIDHLPFTEKGYILVSSLPFRSLPESVHQETVRSILTLLQHNPLSKLIQFTYGRIAPFAVPADFHWRFVTRVWRNVPPAAVWELKFLDKK